MSSMWDPAGRRSSIQIIRDMLDLIRLHELNKTEIMTEININSGQVQRYVTWLTRSGMLYTEVAGDKFVSYKITGRGLRLLSDLETLREMLRRKADTYPSRNASNPDSKLKDYQHKMPTAVHEAD